MENPTNKESYKEAKKKAKEFYSTIGRVWCPTLGDYTVFNNRGFRHLIQKGKRYRSIRDQMRRFFLLRYAKEILTDQTIPFLVRQKGENGNLPSSIKFGALTGTRNKKHITVVVRQVGNGKKHFFSIYDQKITRIE